MFYNYLIFNMVTLSLRILLKYCVSKVETKSFKRLKLSECTVDLIDLTARFNHINHISYSD